MRSSDPVLTTLMLLSAALLPGAAEAASPLDGTWKTDPSTMKYAGKPVERLLKNGIYACNTCDPPSKFPADGKPHRIGNDVYADTAMATVVSATEVDLLFSKGGKPVLTEVITVSTDGATETVSGTDSTAASGAPVKYDDSLHRSGKTPAGAHAISGTWVPEKIGGSDNGMTFTYKTDGDMLTMSSPTGLSFSARFDGPQAPYVGDPGTSTVAVKRIDTHTFQETDYRNGKVIAVGTISVAPDGKTAKGVEDVAVNDQHYEFKMIKQ